MDQLGTEGNFMQGHHKRYLGGVLILLALCGAVYLLAKTVTEVKGFGTAGARPENTIAVTGDGETYVKPDIGTFSFSVREEASKLVDAQKKATDITNKVVDALVKAGVNKEKDLKTIGYNFYPKYTYEQQVCTTTYCPPTGKQQIYAYEVSQTFEVKVHQEKLDKVGELLTTIASLGASDVSGLQFSVDDPDQSQAEARAQAITKARAKAEVLADQLGVRIVRVVSFSENTGPYPIYYAKADMAMGRGGVAESAPPSIPTGENKITSNVTIIYEIR